MLLVLGLLLYDLQKSVSKYEEKIKRLLSRLML